jgi:hypothetical protein
MITRTNQLRDLASECRSIAELSKSVEARQKLLEIAGSLERLAQHYASSRKKIPTPKRRP